LVPRFRFPEFSEEWESILFGKAFDFQQTNTFSRNQMNTQKGKVRNIHYGDVLIKYGYVLRDISTIPYVNEDVDTDKYKNSYLQNGDVVIADTAEDLTAGKAVEVQNVDCNILAGLHTMLCRPNEQAAPGFWGYYINSPAYHNSIITLITGAKVSSISKSNIIKTSVVTTDFAEQQKIADCLFSLDDLITAEDKKIEALRAHKKGLMQKLFPAEGQTVPEWRFPEFRDSGEWDKRPLKEIFYILQGFAFSSSDSVIDGVRWLKIADVSIQRMNYGAPSYLPIEYKKLYEDYLVKQGDCVIALTRPILNGLLKMAMVDKVFEGALLNQRVGKLITNQNSFFVYCLLQTPKIINNIEKNISGSEPPNLSTRQIEDINTYIPSISEQQKIADCLCSVDDLITEQVKKIEALRTHKKGLMQGMFPSVEEVGE